MTAQHRTLHGYAPLRVAMLIQRARAEQVRKDAAPKWPTAVDLARACLNNCAATRRIARHS